MSDNLSNWRSELQANLADEAIQIDSVGTDLEQWYIMGEYWLRFAELAHQQKGRWVAGWAEQITDAFIVNACFAYQGEYLWVRTRLDEEKPKLPSQATVYPAASRSERHTQDMFGIHFIEHPDARAWLRHRAWGKHDYPCVRGFHYKVIILKNNTT